MKKLWSRILEMCKKQKNPVTQENLEVDEESGLPFPLLMSPAFGQSFLAVFLRVGFFFLMLPSSGISEGRWQICM